MTTQPHVNGKYLYAIVGVPQEKVYGSFGIGGSQVYTIPNGKLSAVVSDLPMSTIRPERRHLAAHQEVLKKLMAETTPLPMTFGIIVNSAKEICRILTMNKKTFLEQIHRVENKVEMGLRVSWDVPNIFEYFVVTHPALREARDQCFGNRGEPTQEEKIEVGRIFERILSEDREEQTSKVEEILSPCCAEIKCNPPRNEREVMSLACLVGRESQHDFESYVLKAANLFDNNFTFDYNGPWAPHNFVDAEVQF